MKTPVEKKTLVSKLTFLYCPFGFDWTQGRPPVWKTQGKKFFCVFLTNDPKLPQCLQQMWKDTSETFLKKHPLRLRKSQGSSRLIQETVGKPLWYIWMTVDMIRLEVTKRPTILVNVPRGPLAAVLTISLFLNNSSTITIAEFSAVWEKFMYESHMWM